MPIYKIDKKKDGLQQYRVRVSYTEASGAHKQIERTAYGLSEAKQLETQLSREHAEQPVRRLTVQELCGEYIAAKQSELRQVSLAKSRGILERYVVAELGDVRLDKLTTARLQQWKNSVAARDVGIAMKKHAYGELRALLNFAVKLDFLTKNPLQQLGNFRDADYAPPRDKLQYYTPEEFLKYIAAARENAENLGTVTEWGYYIFFAIAYYTGMRKGEINALRWTDIDGDIIHVRRSITQKIKGVPELETPPKNKSSYRDIQAPFPLIEILSAHQARQQLADGYTATSRVCGGLQCLKDTSIENHNIAFAAAAELPHIRVHDFRHSHASVLANNGISIQEIARRLGHARVEQTWNTYAHLYPREQERALHILNDIF